MKSPKAISVIITIGLFVALILTYYSNVPVAEPAPEGKIELIPTAIIGADCANYPNPNLVPIVETDWLDGSADAPLVAIEYGDFQCPGCASLSKIMKQLKPEYGDRLARVYRHFPTSTHKYAMMTAEAAEAAGMHGQFWPYHDLLYNNQQEWSEVINKEALRVFLIDYGQRVAISDTVSFINLEQHKKKIEAHYLSAVFAGVTGNPALFVNGVLYPVKQRPLTVVNVRDFINKIDVSQRECLGSL